MTSPNFSPFPFAALPRRSRSSAAIESLIARWASARPLGARSAKLFGGAVRIRVIGVVDTSALGDVRADPHAALTEVRLRGESFFVGGASTFARELAQRVLYGPEEFAAPRPLTQAEHAVWAATVAAVLADAKVPGDVWPVVDAARVRPRLDSMTTVLELVVEVEGKRPISIVVWCPSGIRVKTPPPRAWPAWTFDLPIQLGSCALHRDDVARLQVRDVITVDRQLVLVIGDGLVPLTADTGAVEARVASDYVRRDMALPDDAHLELTVQLGTTRLSLRQLADLTPGTIVSLGRPLAGPFDVRAAGRLVGQGELVDVDGELGVRIVSLQE